MREKLIEMILEPIRIVPDKGELSPALSVGKIYASQIADRLIENGVTITETGRWLNRGEGAARWAECSNCHTMGSPRWKVCPVCEARMVNDRG
jgi:hypothetical protein